MYGLLGKTLTHSFSKDIHESFTNVPYHLLESDDLSTFFASTPFLGLNVTIPYKQAVIPYLDSLSEEAAALQTVNTIVRKEGKLHGYNTDYAGLAHLLSTNGIDVSNQVVLILGNGSTSRTIQYYCRQHSARSIIVAARHPNDGEYHMSDHSHYKDASIVFNATPVGMFPNNDDFLPVSLEAMPRLRSVIDVIYNPLRSTLLQAAESLGKQAVNGLGMLIVQAVKAIELFHGISVSEDRIHTYHRALLKRRTNLVLIGMPMSGKSHYARLLAERYGKTLVELDAEIERRVGQSIPDLFATIGESGFRSLEAELVQETATGFHQVISCGGGVVLNADNVRRLKHNGLILFLDMPLAMLQECNPRHRPLLKQPGALKRLFEERYPIYQSCADFIIPKTSYDEVEILANIEVTLHEYFDS